jgi:hypothetical protein
VIFVGTELANDSAAFLDIVYTDPEFVRAEFEAILAASWDDPPDRPARRDRPRPQPLRPRRPRTRLMPRPVPAWASVASGGRQRGPPPPR